MSEQETTQVETTTETTPTDSPVNSFREQMGLAPQPELPIETEKLSEGEEPAKAAPDTETETAPKPADTETETVKPDYASLMAEYKLDGQYKSVEDVLKSVPAMRQELGERDRKINNLLTTVEKLANKQTEQPKAAKKEYTQEELNELAQTDPDKWFDAMADRRGYVKRDEIDPVLKSVDSLQEQQAQQIIISSIRTKPELTEVADYYAKVHNAPPEGFNARWDAMMARYKLQPSLGNLPGDEFFDILYQLTADTPKAKPVIPVRTPGKPEHATTSGADRGGKPQTLPPEYANWDSGRQLDYLVKHGLARVV